MLIVEDDPDLVELLQEYLAESGFQDVAVLDNGDELSKMVEDKKTKTPDVMILDFRLPGASGLYLLPRIRETWPLTKIVVYTGLEEKHHELLEVFPYIDRLLKKSIPVSKLVQTVKELAADAGLVT